MTDVYQMLADALRERDTARLDAACMRDLLRSKMAGSTNSEIERMHSRTDPAMRGSLAGVGMPPLNIPLATPFTKDPPTAGKAPTGPHPEFPVMSDPVPGTSGPPHEPPPGGRPDRPPATIQHPTRPGNVPQS